MKHTRKCALPTCNKEFKTNRMWQIFCCKDHQEEYWKLYRHSESQVRREVEILKKEQRKIKDKLGIK